jgi:hypothetical protein
VRNGVASGLEFDAQDVSERLAIGEERDAARLEELHVVCSSPALLVCPGHTMLGKVKLNDVVGSVAPDWRGVHGDLLLVAQRTSMHRLDQAT